MKKVILTCLSLIWVISLLAQKEVRLKENFDFDWNFSLSDNQKYADRTYNDESWERIQLPHDWSIKLSFDKKMGGSAAHLPGGIGWYRKQFKLPRSYNGKVISILFDAICHQSDVYINGHHLGFRPYGFCSIEYDLTPYLDYDGENVIAVRVNRSGVKDVARWYTGSGIYRHAWLQVTNPVHVATYGTYVTTPSVSEDKAQIRIMTTLENELKKVQTVSISHLILDNQGKIVAKSGTEKTLFEAGQSIKITQNLTLNYPRLWTLEKPELYTLETTVKANGKVTDLYKTPFGIRTIAFDSEKGFLLNGKQVKLKGMCLHQDAGSLGTAVLDRSYERRLEIIKEYGCNAIRCSHNQPSPEFLDMCDRMGFVVIDEAFDKWKSGYYEKYFDEWWQRDLENMILRDRNHPSIILWSIGNEVTEAWEQGNEGIKRAEMLRDFVHKLEPSRPVTLAAQNNHRGEFSAVADVVGYNYLEARLLTDRKNNPKQRFLVSEELPYYSGAEGNIRSYTVNNPWNVVAAHDFIAGGFIWSGVDYLGEASWPSHGWPNGLFDICMFEKPRAAFHRAMWNPEPMVGIAIIDQSLDIDHGRDLWQWPKMVSHWSFPHRYFGLIMEVRTTTNCEKVELFMNDKSMGVYNTVDYPNHTIIWNVPYTPGKLVAKGYNGNKIVATKQLITSYKTTDILLKQDRTEIKADGQDLSHVAVQLCDKDGNPVQVDDRKLTVSVEGDGTFRGLDTGDLRRETPFGSNELKTYFGQALIIVQSTRKAGQIKVNIQVEGIEKVYSTIITTHS